MAIEKINIESFLELAKQHPVLDVRSPGEFQHAHIPGAYSLPLFTDEERKWVGTAYKQQSREQAIKVGLDFFAPKMKQIIENAEKLVGSLKSDAGPDSTDSGLPTPDSRFILVYCWRGGMRSAAVAWLLDLYGFKVCTLNGGYKKFRKYVLDTFGISYPLKIVGGYTGSGKTELLRSLQQKGEKVIDLEGIANHKGSAFGNIGLPAQPTQEMFENILATELRRSVVNSEWSINDNDDSPLTTHHSSLWLEDESQRIGQVNIPGELWKNMRKSPVYFLDIPFEERLGHIVQEYGQLNQEKLIDAINRISQKLGNLNAKTAILLLKEGKIAESFDILLKYYDKHYLKSLHNREGVNSLLYTVKCKSVTPDNANQLILHPQSRFQTT